MTATADFLVEIGTEELPPKALRGLMQAFAAEFASELDQHRLAHGEVRGYASPRRLAVLVEALAPAQADREVELKGPPVSVAFGDDGKPGPAAVAFAKKCGVAVDALERRTTDKGEWLYCSVREAGEVLERLAPRLVAAALGRVPVPRPMRWGSGDAEFVRPVHWVVMLHGDRLVEGEVFGIAAGRETRGHRFMAPAPIALRRAGEFEDALADHGRVVADFDRRRTLVQEGVGAAAREAGGVAVADDALYDEVAALVEWPVALTGSFDRSFLSLPREVIVATLTGHQRYFPVEDADGKLLDRFVTVANLESRDPDTVRDGNERVIRPRLEDAAFFWKTDTATPLADRLIALNDVVHQQGLGSIGDKARRVARLARRLATAFGAEDGTAERAALLSKCDLVTGMVGEFPELQGTMGQYYAAESGEPADVARAIGEHYRPVFAGDGIAASAAGRAVAVADRLDTLCGIFALGKRPSGNKDPFGLRRAALGVVRTAIESGAEFDLAEAVRESLSQQPCAADEAAAEGVYDFIVERLKAYAAEELGASPEVFDAVRDRRPASLTDFARRIDAVRRFVDLDAAASLAAANKRIANILRQAGGHVDASVRPDLFGDAAETLLYDELEQARAETAPLAAAGDYTGALTRLALLREAVDRFFDDVMVMDEDDAVRSNRLALLAGLRDEFLAVADISRLAIR